MKTIFRGMILIIILGMGTPAFCSDAVHDYDACFDCATGHRYNRVSPTAFAEYSRRGKLLKPSVAETKPVLSQNRHIKPITEDSYILYEKSNGQKRYQMILPVTKAHPKGWYSINVFYSSR